VRLFERVVASAPQDAELQLALGVLHHLNRRFDNAIAAFQRALELRPGDYRWAARGWGACEVTWCWQRTSDDYGDAFLGGGSDRDKC
jgi:tetratricopeptide (TPR) repeat protein